MKLSGASGTLVRRPSGIVLACGFLSLSFKRVTRALCAVGLLVFKFLAFLVGELRVVGCRLITHLREVARARTRGTS